MARMRNERFASCCTYVLLGVSAVQPFGLCKLAILRIRKPGSITRASELLGKTWSRCNGDFYQVESVLLDFDRLREEVASPGR